MIIMYLEILDLVQLPQLVFLCEDTIHAGEVFKTLVLTITNKYW